MVSFAGLCMFWGNGQKQRGLYATWPRDTKMRGPRYGPPNFSTAPHSAPATPRGHSSLKPEFSCLGTATVTFSLGHVHGNTKCGHCLGAPTTKPQNAVSNERVGKTHLQ